jgi:hypothetical protein
VALRPPPHVHVTAHLLAESQGQKPSSTETKKTMQNLFGVRERSQERILASGQVRTLHNQPDLGPYPRSRPKTIPHQDTVAIGDYLDDPRVPLNDKGKPWKDVANNTGVELPLTAHFKPPGYREVEPQTIQRSCKEDEGIINAKCEEERLLTKAQARLRILWYILALLLRPRS